MLINKHIIVVVLLLSYESWCFIQHVHMYICTYMQLCYTSMLFLHQFQYTGIDSDYDDEICG